VKVGNGSYVPWIEGGSRVPVLERFLPFRDGYIQRLSDAGKQHCYAGKSVFTD